jgi:hypothetical protein
MSIDIQGQIDALVDSTHKELAQWILDLFKNNPNYGRWPRGPEHIDLPYKLPPDVEAGSPLGNRFGYSYIEELRERAGGSFYIDANDKLRFVARAKDGYIWDSQ